MCDKNHRRTEHERTQVDSRRRLRACQNRTRSRGFRNAHGAAAEHAGAHESERGHAAVARTGARARREADCRGAAAAAGRLAWRDGRRSGTLRAARAETDWRAGGNGGRAADELGSGTAAGRGSGKIHSRRKARGWQEAKKRATKDDCGCRGGGGNFEGISGTAKVSGGTNLSKLKN